MSEKLVPIDRPLVFGDIVAYSIGSSETLDRNLYLCGHPLGDGYIKVLELRTATGEPGEAHVCGLWRSDFQLVVEE